MMQSLPSADLEHILDKTCTLWEPMRGARMFVTGGTGFFGVWLLGSLEYVNHELDLGIEVVVLTRDPSRFQATQALRFHRGDVRDFKFPEGRFSHVIHAATPVTEASVSDSEIEEIILSGTRRTLEFAHASGAKEFLHISSGAACGRQPPQLTHVSEDYQADLATLKPGYAAGKRRAEEIALQSGLNVKIARGFAFVGPHLPLDAHFAIGNFIQNVLKGEPIRLRGDGTPYRSYLYAADLAIWLWSALVRGRSGGIYHLGSEDGRSLAELAQTVARIGGGAKIEIQGVPSPGILAERYVPGTARTRKELEVQEWISLDEGIRRTIDWNRETKKW